MRLGRRLWFFVGGAFLLILFIQVFHGQSLSLIRLASIAVAHAANQIFTLLSSFSFCLRTLRKINLSDCSVTGVGARYLGDAISSTVVPSAVTTLILDNNPVRAPTILLEKKRRSESLFTHQASSFSAFPQQIGPDGGRYLGQALRTNGSIITVKLNNCGLGDEGAIALAQALPNNTSVTYCCSPTMHSWP